MEGNINQLLKNKQQALVKIAPTDTVLTAVSIMNEKKIGAVLVVDDRGDLVGIFTERDILTKVISKSKPAMDVKVADVMSSNLLTVRGELSVYGAMKLITEKRFRHLPVVEDGQLRGLVSIGDITRYLAEQQAIHIKDLENYIDGQSY
jgi:CBS domain-containing protein